MTIVAALCLLYPCNVRAKSAGTKARSSALKENKDAKKNKSDEQSPEKSLDKSGEDYADLIQKAQNLTLQQDRLQTSQVLIRGIQRESRNSAAYKELVRALDELTSVFYTEKTQGVFSAAESLSDLKPREALERFQEALKLEEKNVLILKALARVHLRLDECEKADQRVKAAEEMDPYSAEIKLLRLQILACQKDLDQLGERLEPAELDSVEKYSRGLQMLDLMNRKETKKVKALLASWESQAADYPEVYYWKWQSSKGAGTVDRSAAAKYSQLCQNLTPRKRKTFSLDVDLCKNKDAADLFLREKEAPPEKTTGESSGESH